jgi:hypothetical protein
MFLDRRMIVRGLIYSELRCRGQHQSPNGLQWIEMLDQRVDVIEKGFLSSQQSPFSYLDLARYDNVVPENPNFRLSDSRLTVTFSNLTVTFSNLTMTFLNLTVIFSSLASIVPGRRDRVRFRIFHKLLESSI